MQIRSYYTTKKKKTTTKKKKTNKKQFISWLHFKTYNIYLSI